MIRQILFDLGGVFIRLDREESVRRFREIGVHDADRLLDPYRQSGLFLALESGRYSAETFARELSTLYRLPITPDQVRHALLGFVHGVEPHKFAFIEERLSPHFPLLLLSNTNEYIHDWAESSAFLPSGKPLSHFFHRMYLSYRLGICKPERELFDQIIGDAGIRPEETLFVDDGPANTATARALGFVTYCPENGEDWTTVLTKLLGV